MRARKEHASSRSSTVRYFESILAGHTTSSTLQFTPLPLPDMGLTFLPRPQPRPRKRSRAAADIDGDHSCLQKKKRRLRLFLITSRLSPQFSHPATNIVDRGSSKIAVWAKQKSLGRNLLRKAAILNHIRRRAVSIRELGDDEQRPVQQEKERNELALAKLEFNYGSVDTYTRPVTSRNPSVPPAGAVRTGGKFVVSGSPTGSPTSSRSPSPTSPSPPSVRSPNDHTSEYRSPNEAYAHSLPRAQIPRRDYIPLPPSPLGLSNYDAFDADEDITDPYSHLDDEEDLEFGLFDEEEVSDAVPFSPSADTSTSSTTMQTRVSQGPKTPIHTVQSNLNILDHGEPVIRDYDQIEDGVDTVWPSVLSKEATRFVAGSTSPDFNALFATAPSKRSDSFATSPNLRPTISNTLHAPASPNLAPASPNFKAASPNLRSASPRLRPASPNLTSASPNFTSATASSSTIPAFAASATSPNLVTTAISPNLVALDAPSAIGNAATQRRMSMPSGQRQESHTRRYSNMTEEQKRQQDHLYRRFGS
jgi:hypothetical protein